MLFRALGVFACLFPIGWGIYSTHAGYNSHEFGPMLGGLFFMFLGFMVMLIIVYDYLEQIVNKYRGLPPGTPDGILDDGTIIEFKTMSRSAHGESQYVGFCSDPVINDCLSSRECALMYGALPQTPEEHAFVVESDTRLMRELNTPDPHLIHPDDLKRQQASGHDDYPIRNIKA